MFVLTESAVNLSKIINSGDSPGENSLGGTNQYIITLMKPSIRVNLVFVLVPAGYAFKPETVQTVLASRTEILDEQDRGLDSLYEVIVRQKRIAQNIEGEVEVQVTRNIS